MTNIEFSFIIIDDSELDCYVTQKFLKLTDHRLIVKTFDNAKKALEMIREKDSLNGNAPSIILLDLQMPGMNGFKFVEEFEKFPSHIKKGYLIIVLTVLTSANDPSNIQKILTHETVNRVIEKPLTKEKLITLLEHVRSNI
ncbi:MAG TPA: response regulator [Mucilaginibacter sp.]|jgi:CheY-like chemotaxis protein